MERTCRLPGLWTVAVAFLCAASAHAAVAPSEALRSRPLGALATGADLVFQMPYQGSPTPASHVLAAPTSIQYLDLYLLVDRTGSMAAELAALSSQFISVVAALQCAQSGPCAVDGDCPPGEVCVQGTCTTLPSSPACAPSIFTGVGRFDDCSTYFNLVSVQANPSTTQNAIPSPGGGAAEAPFQALARIADPTNSGYGVNFASCSPSGVGCPGFRPDALHVLIHVTDADNQAAMSCASVSLNQAATELAQGGIRYGAVVGNGDDSSTPGTPLQMAQQIGIASGSVDGTGQPFAVFAIDAAVPNAIRDVVRSMLTQMPGDVTVEVVDDDTDAVDARQFVDYVQVHMPGGTCTSGLNTEDRQYSDGRDDTFLSVLPGTPVCWTIVPSLNTTVPQAATDQTFPAFLVVRALGSVVHTTRVLFVVPATTVSVPPPDASRGAWLGLPRPNPSRGSVTCEFAAPAEGTPIELAVFDSQGRLIRVLGAERSAHGGIAVWDGRNAAGARVQAGVYHVRMRAGSTTLTRKVTIAD